MQNNFFFQPLGYKPFPGSFKENVSLSELVKANDQLRESIKKDMQNGYLVEMVDFDTACDRVQWDGPYNKYYFDFNFGVTIFYVLYDQYCDKWRVFLVWSGLWNHPSTYVGYDRQTEPWTGVNYTYFSVADLDEKSRKDACSFDYTGEHTYGRMPSILHDGRFNKERGDRVPLLDNQKIEYFRDYTRPFNNGIIEKEIPIETDSRWKCKTILSDGLWLYGGFKVHFNGGDPVPWGKQPVIISSDWDSIDQWESDGQSWRTGTIRDELMRPDFEVREDFYGTRGGCTKLYGCSYYLWRIKYQGGELNPAFVEPMKRNVLSYLMFVMQQVGATDFDPLKVSWELDLNKYKYKWQTRPLLRYWGYKEIADMLYNERLNDNRVALVRDKFVVPPPEEETDYLTWSEQSWIEEERVVTDYLNNIGWFVPEVCKIHQRRTNDFWAANPQYKQAWAICTPHELSDTKQQLSDLPLIGKYADSPYEYVDILVPIKFLKAFGRSANDNVNLDFPTIDEVQIALRKAREYKREYVNDRSYKPRGIERPVVLFQQDYRALDAAIMSGGTSQFVYRTNKLKEEVYVSCRAYWRNLVIRAHHLEDEVLDEVKLMIGGKDLLDPAVYNELRSQLSREDLEKIERVILWKKSKKQ